MVHHGSLVTASHGHVGGVGVTHISLLLGTGSRGRGVAPHVAGTARSLVSASRRAGLHALWTRGDLEAHLRGCGRLHATQGGGDCTGGWGKTSIMSSCAHGHHRMVDGEELAMHGDDSSTGGVCV